MSWSAILGLSAAVFLVMTGFIGWAVVRGGRVFDEVVEYERDCRLERDHEL